VGAAAECILKAEARICRDISLSVVNSAAALHQRVRSFGCNDFSTSRVEYFQYLFNLHHHLNLLIHTSLRHRLSANVLRSRIGALCESQVLRQKHRHCYFASHYSSHSDISHGISRCRIIWAFCHDKLYAFCGSNYGGTDPPQDSIPLGGLYFFVP